MLNKKEFSRSLAKRAKALHVVSMFLAMQMVLPGTVAQQSVDPLSRAEIEQTRSALMHDARINQKIHGNRYRILNIERHENSKQATTAVRAANATLYNYTTDETISAVVRLGSNPAVEAIAVTRNLQPSLSDEELLEAKQLAIADPIVQSQLRNSGSSGNSTESLTVTHLLAHSENANDACSTHRCIILFFNTAKAVLPVTPVVDLSAQKVQRR